jgi:hypothetical protein
VEASPMAPSEHSEWLVYGLWNPILTPETDDLQTLH